MTTATHNDRFGAFGGRYVPETLIPALDELDAAFDNAMADEEFVRSVDGMLSTYVGRPSPLSTAPRLSSEIGASVYLKREDLNHTGAHKINNTVGQALLARRMGKRRIIAETGAGQHGVATATICARFGLACVVCYMVFAATRRAPIVIRSWELDPPTLSLAVSQFVVATVDWALAAYVAWVLLPRAPGLTFVGFLGLFVMATNLVVATDPAGNVKPNKAKSTGRIDGLAAAINALDRAARNEGPKPSIYETRGLASV